MAGKEEQGSDGWKELAARRDEQDEQGGWSIDGIGSGSGCHRNSNGLYPIKSLVICDPESARSWNYCWLVLVKIERMNLIPKHARALASRPEMWGAIQPSPQHVDQLANEWIQEWTRALHHMLRHWDTPPTVTGR
ncbi:hypothetical protein VTN96DRAFT_4729 [Rasamsonia emersonii]